MNTAAEQELREALRTMNDPDVDVVFRVAESEKRARVAKKIRERIKTKTGTVIMKRPTEPVFEVLP